MAAKNTLCHFEIMSRDTKRAADFYQKLFGWNLSYDMGEDYILVRPEGEPSGAISKSDSLAPGGGLGIYFQVDDVDKYLKKAVELGAREITPKREIPNVGWYGLFADLDGNTIGLYMSH